MATFELYYGDVPERLNGPHSKCGIPARVSEVQILPSPQAGNAEPSPKNMLNFIKKEKKEPENLKEVLVELNKLDANFKKISKELENLKKEKVFSVQKFSIIRFNPFNEVGGDQSFSIALLDGYDCGMVLTSHYTRNGNRVYAKPVKNGRSEYTLSEEEVRAINSAKNFKDRKILENKEGKKEKGNKEAKENNE